jgi:hypothetical protein
MFGEWLVAVHDLIRHFRCRQGFGSGDGPGLLREPRNMANCRVEMFGRAEVLPLFASVPRERSFTNDCTFDLTMKATTNTWKLCLGTRSFTSVELVALICTVCVLLLVFTGKSTSRSAVLMEQCQTNLRELGCAWDAYAQDSEGRLVWNRDGGNAGKDQLDRSWAGGWLDYGERTDNTNFGLLVNHDRYPHAALLGSYTKDSKLYKCPSDRSVANMGGERLPRVRSYSMNSRVGAGTRSWRMPTRFTQYTEISHFKSPEGVFVFTEEREDSINDPVFK